MKTITNGKDVFELVAEVPEGFEVWCIPSEGIEGYLPLAELANVEHRQVNTNTLKAIYLGEEVAKALHDAQMWLGTTNMAKLEAYANRNANSKNAGTQRKVQKALRAIKLGQGVKGL